MNKRQLLIQRGFAHGFVVLSDEAIFSYKVDNYYSTESERGISFDDPNLGINWQIALSDLQLSAKDQNQPTLSETIDLFDFGVDYYE